MPFAVLGWLNGVGEVYKIPVFLLAEGVGFEPTGRYRPLIFKTSAFNHSATPPIEKSVS